ncbi:hypothetical protein TWF481_005668 [Arthrobotrys musiformis]|uniref:Uncharacterized protein n=1 Tax=Arthrobotrys musiformis TaxID=47236 RepID=A0AAV9WEK2_9PEZI
MPPPQKQQDHGLDSSCYITVHDDSKSGPSLTDFEIHEYIDLHKKPERSSHGQVGVRTNIDASANKPRAPCTCIDTKNGEEVRANFEIGFDWPGPGKRHPIHETIAIAAFIRSDIHFHPDTTYYNLSPQQWEYFRGLIWNDDPSCLLFKRSEDNNHWFGAGIEFYAEFIGGKPNRMTQRSHYRDLQFLHAMGSRDGELPHHTRGRLLDWMGVMYRLACGDQGVEENHDLREHFPGLFSGDTDPSEWATLRDLILGTTPEYRNTQIPLRALGICLHTIQDSYAMGHTQRRLLNPQDFSGRDLNGYLNFKLGTWAKWGPIVSFHGYKNQNHDRHGFYDGLEGAGLPDPKNLGSFNRLNGARDAIDASIFLMNAFAHKRLWEDVRRDLEAGIFALDRYAKPCNTDVDGEIPGLNSYPVSNYDEKLGSNCEADLTHRLATPQTNAHRLGRYQKWIGDKRRRWMFILISFLLVGKIVALLYFLLFARH